MFMFGTAHVNWYEFVDGQSITVVDMGLPHYWSQIEELLTSLGRSVADIETVLAAIRSHR